MEVTSTTQRNVGKLLGMSINDEETLRLWIPLNYSIYPYSNRRDTGYHHTDFYNLIINGTSQEFSNMLFLYSPAEIYFSKEQALKAFHEGEPKEDPIENPKEQESEEEDPNEVFSFNNVLNVQKDLLEEDGNGDSKWNAPIEDEFDNLGEIDYEIYPKIDSDLIGSVGSQDSGEITGEND